ncbi:MAG TPA: phosphoglycolate phosphatase [Methanocorpusculum sp.]|nr:phosphoglycolate phosphatase [Methanocorpusculum sp.]
MVKAFITDIDGTLTDAGRRLSLSAVAEIRRLIDADVPVVFASGNTVCFLDALSHMIGTDGNVIAENGGAYRKGFLGELHIEGDHDLCYAAYQKVIAELQPKGNELRLFSINLRYSDVAFAHGTDLKTVQDIIAGMNVEAVDTGFAIHLHTPGLSKGKAFENLARDMGLSPSDFLAAGDSENDISMLDAAGKAVAPANSSLRTKDAVAKKGTAGFISEQSFGDAVAEALKENF